MSTPHNFSDDPSAFPGPPPESSNTKTVILVLAAILGVVVLVCGGFITAGVFIARQAAQEFEQVFDQMQAEAEAEREQLAEYEAAAARGDYQAAFEIVDQRLASSPDDANSHNNKAWLLATCPDEVFRDGELALEHATKACELTDWQFAGFIDTLAAAHAELGDFEAAAEWQQKAIDADTEDQFADEFQQRLTLYQSEQPYREGAEPAIDVDGQNSSGILLPADSDADAGAAGVDAESAEAPGSQTSQE